MIYTLVFSEFGSTTMNLYMYKVNISNYSLNTNFYTKNTIVEMYNSELKKQPPKELIL